MFDEREARSAYRRYQSISDTDRLRLRRELDQLAGRRRKLFRLATLVLGFIVFLVTISPPPDRPTVLLALGAAYVIALDVAMVGMMVMKRK